MSFFNWLKLLYWRDSQFVLIVSDFNKQQEYVIYFKTLYNSIVLKILYFYKRLLMCFITTPCLDWILIAKDLGLLKGQ